MSPRHVTLPYETWQSILYMCAEYDTSTAKNPMQFACLQLAWLWKDARSTCHTFRKIIHKIILEKIVRTTEMFLVAPMDPPYPHISS